MASSGTKLLRIICISVLLVLILLGILILILAVTVFNPKRPIITVDSVSLLDLNVSIFSGVDLSFSLIMALSAENPNKVAFEYSESTAIVNYRGEQVGEAMIPSGQLPAEGTEKMNLTLTMKADRMLANVEVFTDVVSGRLPISTFARLSGKMKVMSVFKISVVAASSCDVIINVKNGNIEDQKCEYRTKL